MKDDFATKEALTILESRIVENEYMLHEKASLSQFDELFHRVRIIEDSYERDEYIATMRWNLEALQKEVKLLRKSIEDYLLYKPEDLQFDEII